MPAFATVTVRQGALRGRSCRTPNGSVYFSFQGVPYAQPPVVHRRFKAPVPLESWTGIRDATKESHQSVQLDPFSNKIVGDEDCLFLNVSTPRLPTGRSSDTPQPVLVFFHGGGFMRGSSYMYGPEPLMDQGVILVTVNYRLGPLGFMSLGITDAPGNAGLKDQSMALRWVKDNIVVFGGDPNNVTIFGESAGSASVHLHVLSPMSKGLFRRAIAQSGTALCFWAITRDPVGRAKRLALAAGCDWDTTEDLGALLKWYRQVPAEKLVMAVEGSRTKEDIRRSVFALFIPCVEPDYPDVFLPDDPNALLAKGTVNRVPIIFGINSHEGIFLLPRSILRMGLVPLPAAAVAAMARGDMAPMKEAEEQALVELANDMERVLPEELLGPRRDPERSRRLLEQVQDFYFDGQPLTEDTIEGLVHLITDTFFTFGVMLAASEHARLGSPVYLYEFAFGSPFNFFSSRVGCRVLGASHGDELGYQFNMTGARELEEGSPEVQVRSHLGRLWTNFARKGNPTPSVGGEMTATWLPFSESTPNYLRITEDITTGTGPLNERTEFWENLLSN